MISFRPAEIEGATVHHIDGFEAIGKARYVVHARRVRALIETLQPDLLHALHLTSYGFLAGLSGFQPSIVSVWGTDVLEAPDADAAAPLDHAARAGARGRDHGDGAAAGGGDAAVRAGGEAGGGDPVRRGPRAVRRRRHASSAATRALTIGAVSRLSPEKGFEYLLRAVAMLRDRGVELDVVLAGDGPSRPALERLADELGLRDRVEFLGEVAHDDVPAMLQRLDIFAMPSTWEGFGVSALEASAMELPVVASDIHGIPDVVLDGETGLLVPPADVGALADAIGRLAGDAALRRAMGVAGRAYVEREYRWQDNAALMERLYAEMTASPARS